MKKLFAIAIAVLMISALAVTSFAASFNMDELAWSWGVEYDAETRTVEYSGAWKGAAFKITNEDDTVGVSTVTIDFDTMPMIDLQMGIQDTDGNEIASKWFPAGTDFSWTFEIPEGSTVFAIEIKASGAYTLVIKDIYTNGEPSVAGEETDEPADEPVDEPADEPVDEPADEPADDTTTDTPAEDTTETPADTGLVFALVPMAVALAAIAFSKKR